MNRETSPTEDEIRAYYAARAPEYDRIYQKPERQDDLLELVAYLPSLFVGRRVLDIACGTGFWTQHIAPVSKELIGVDAAASTLAIAQARVSGHNARFIVGDAYNVPDDTGYFDGAFAGFWYSHIPVNRRHEFFANLAKRLSPGATVALLDNRYVEGSNHPITDCDEQGNTYQSRKLDDGSEHKVLKNFPTEAELVEATAGVGTNAVFRAWEYYWVFTYDAFGG